MSAVDEAMARKALAWRLKDWGVTDVEAKARLFIDELVDRGWRMAPEREQRPRPPKVGECCHHCGRHADRCICETSPQGQPAPPAADHSAQVLRLRRLASDRNDGEPA